MDSSYLPVGDGTHHPPDHQQPQSQPPPQPHLPPGFRFHPTDEELVVHYLKRKVQNVPLPVSIIAEVDLYKFDPWELPAKAVFGEQEWYFFSPRDRKYPKGARPNRAATSGYWKATGTDKPVLSSGNNQKVGVKKALVFYGGKPPRGMKSNWIMHEYRLVDNKPNNKPPGYDLCNNTNKKGSLRLDDWVLCRIYKKNNMNNRPMDHHEREDSMEDMLMMGPMSMSMSIPCSINSIGVHQHQLSTTIGSLNYNTLLDNQNVQQGTIFDGMMGTAHHGMDPTSSTNPLPYKRPFPSLFWGSDDGNGGSSGDNDNDNNNNNNDPNNVGHICSPGKKVSLLQFRSNNSNNNNNNNSSEESGVRGDQHGNINNDNLNSMPSLLNQLPSQASPVPVLDGMFRQSYPFPGLNWYS